MAVEAEVLFDVEEYLLELAQFVIGLVVFGLERLHFVVDLLGVLALLAFVLFQPQSLALLRRFPSGLLLRSLHALALRQSRCWIPDSHITSDIFTRGKLLLVHPLKFNLLNFSGFSELLDEFRTPKIFRLGGRMFGTRKALGRRLFVVTERLVVVSNFTR